MSTGKQQSLKPQFYLFICHWVTFSGQGYKISPACLSVFLSVCLSTLLQLNRLTYRQRGMSWHKVFQARFLTKRAQHGGCQHWGVFIGWSFIIEQSSADSMSSNWYTVEPWYKDHLWAAAKAVFIVRWSLYWGGRDCNLWGTNIRKVEQAALKVVFIARWSL